MAQHPRFTLPAWPAVPGGPGSARAPCAMFAFALLAFASASLTGGCALHSAPFAPPAQTDLPAAWSGAAGQAQATPLQQWWRRFDDPVLDALVAQALQANTSVLGAQAALQQARALREVSAAGLLPQVGSSASAQRGTSGGDSTGSSFRLGLDASWEIDVFGTQRNALAASDAGARASAASLGDVQVSVTAEVALAYIGLRNDQARLAIADENLGAQLQTLQITEWRVQAGLLSGLEAQQAQAAAAQTRAQLPALRTAIAQSGHALAVLTGRPPAALAAQLAAATPVPRAQPGLALSLPAETLRQRPDVRAAEHQLAAAAARVSQAQAARLPSFNLGGSVGLSALTLGALTSGAAVATSLLASVHLPVFDGGAARAQVRAQQAAQAQAEAAYRATVLAALREVEDALVALRGERERQALLLQAADAATQAAQLARQLYGSGLVDFQTVLDTQRTRLGAQDSLAGSRAELSADHVRLFKALGGGWQPDAEAATSSPTLQRTPP